MTFNTLELRCSRELAEKLGALDPASPQHHRELRASGAFIMIRDESMRPMFWPVVASDVRTISKSS